MVTALNMTMRLKQDADSLAQLQHLKDVFPVHIQPMINDALKKSGTVHFARVLVIDDRYIQVITEFDGARDEYTEFFRRELPIVFKSIFSLVENVPPWEELNTQDMFYTISKGFQVRALGESTQGNADEGWLFSALGDTTLREISEALKLR